jgi:ectoine hydroxylase-related dioxygenase (phytanoyl-CoA dioxygenase family)
MINAGTLTSNLSPSSNFVSKLNQEQIAQFDRDGYLMVKELFDVEEMNLLMQIAKADQQIAQNAQERLDLLSGRSKLWITGNLGEDIYSALVHCHRIVDPLEQLLRGEVYHYHHKIMLKEPLVGGAWEWHQDYGYWYSKGCLFPDMASCLIAIDAATIENGCLQVIKGSHRMGRIDHGKAGEQTGADLNRVNEALKHLELVHCEMQPGTALFFHCNLLHRSDANNSPHPRLSLICCYNAARNPCEDKPNHSSYRQLEKWPDSRIKEIGHRQLDGLVSEST